MSQTDRQQISSTPGVHDQGRTRQAGLRPRVFLLSPANCGGERASTLLNSRAGFALAEQLRAGTALLGEVFSFVSGLYFRGKLTYARTFAEPPGDPTTVWVITPTRGLLSPDMPVSIEALQEFAGVDVHPSDERYRLPLDRDARTLDAYSRGSADAILLGSIATAKYTEILARVFGRRLRFPTAFIGRGDMSRGALLLRAAREHKELEYSTVGAVIPHGPRAPRISDMG